MMTQFELDIETEDVIRNDDFHKKYLGYIVLIEDNGPMRKIVEKVCKSFIQGSDNFVFEICPRTIT